MVERLAKRSRILTSAPPVEPSPSSSAVRITCTNNNARFLATRSVTIRTSGGARDARRPGQRTGHSQILANPPEHNIGGVLDQDLGNMDVDGLNEESSPGNQEVQKDGPKRSAVSSFSTHFSITVLRQI